MSKKTYLKIFSILLIVFGAFLVVFSAMSLAGGTMIGSLGALPEPEAAEDQAVQTLAVTVGVMAIVLGVVMLLVGLFDLITGILGFRVAKGNMRCAGAAKVMGIIGMVCVAAVNIYIVANNPTFETICSALASIGLQECFVWGVTKVQQESKALAE